MDQFKEEQRLFKSQVPLMVVAAVLIMLGAFNFPSAEQLRTNNEVILLVIPGIGLLLVFILISSLRLETEVNAVGVYYRMHPFHRNLKLIRWEKIRHAEVSKTPFSAGYKKALKKTPTVSSYLIGGKMSLQLELKDGKKVIVGTRLPNEMRAVLNNLIKSRRVNLTALA